MTGQLAQPFPPPSGDELRKAYNDLYFAVNGDEQKKKQIGNPNKLPRPLDPPTCTKPALRRELWKWLDEVVIWFNHEYVWDHNAGMIPACWPQHPHLVHEIAVLADQRRRAGIDPTSSALEEWHRYGVPGFLERLKTRTKNGCDEHHAEWPAEGRYRRQDSGIAVSERASRFADDVSTLAPPTLQPVPTQPVLHLVRSPSGELIDP
ncbi:MAG TPA: hypothetical protein VGK53_21305, partial [Propionicimonas sp.]